MTTQPHWRSRLTRFTRGESPLAIWPGCEGRLEPLDPLREDVRSALGEAEHWRDLFEMASITRNLSFDLRSSLPEPPGPIGRALRCAARLPAACLQTLAKPPALATAGRDPEDDQTWN
jgi:hypothetical protein